MHKYLPLNISTHVETDFAITAAITVASLLGYVAIRLADIASGIFAHSSSQNRSCAFKLDGLCH